jgi:hypothetical protein
MISAEKIFQDLESMVYHDVISAHNERCAFAAAGIVFDCLYLNFRDQLMYIPTSDGEVIQQRNKSIWGDFTGFNQQELSVKYRLSTQQIYTIIKRMRGASEQQNHLSDISAPAHNKQPLMLQVIYEYLPAELIYSGLVDNEAFTLSRKIAEFLCKQFPGVAVCIPGALKEKRRQAGSLICFNG